jgi:hypothetical protein
MPEETVFVLSVISSSGDNNKVFAPKTRQVQKEWSREITAKGMNTYAQEGYDTTTGFPVVHTYPEATSALSVRYCPQPAELAATTDLIVGPREVYHYIKWEAHEIRLFTNEERINLRQESDAKSKMYLSRLRSANRMFLQAQPNYISIAG